MAIDLDAFIKSEGIGYAHNFGEEIVIGKNDLVSLNKSKVEGKYVVTIQLNSKVETVDYLTSKDLLALKDDKLIKCTWTRSRSGKPYWNHSSTYISKEE
jgi:hypothetical protein